MRGVFLVTVPLFAGLILGCRGPGASGKSDAARVSLAGEVAACPPYYCGGGYEAAALGEDGTCGLMLVPLKADQRPPEAIWMHRVIREIPGPSDEARLAIVKGIGFSDEDIRRWSGKGPIRGTAGSLGMGRGWPRAKIFLDTAEYFKLRGIQTS